MNIENFLFRSIYNNFFNKFKIFLFQAKNSLSESYHILIKIKYDFNQGV